MIQFFLVLLSLLRAVVGAYRRDPQFRALTLLLLVTLLAGMLFYSNVEGWSLLDALYFSVTTLATVGYGDLSPQTAAGKVFTIVYILTGLGILAGFVNALAKETLDRRTGRGEPEQGEPEDPG